MEIVNQIVMKKISEVKPYVRNPRKNDKTVNLLVEIIPKVGFNVPLVIDRNHEIVDAFDDLLSWYRENGLYETYRDELCRLAIDHLFLAASVRVLMANPKHPLLREFYQYMQQHFPQFQSNRYVSQLPRAKKLAFDLLRKKRYRIVRALFLVKNRL